MTQNEFTYKSPADGLEISALAIEPEGEIRAVILMSHGIMEYKERFIPLMSFFAENGFVCAMNDHRGYGKSVKAPEDNGYTYGKGAEGTMQDMRALAEILIRKYPGKKLFVYGHSMGALCAMCFIKRYGKDLSGAILSGLPEYNSAVGVGQKYLKVKKLFKGDRYRDQSVNKLMFDSYASKLKDSQSPFCWINSDPEKVKEYEADPLCGQLGTLDGYISLLDLMTEAYNKKGWDKSGSMMPVFIAVGADDPCAGGDKGGADGEAFLKSMGLVRAEHKTYPRMRHELHNEPEKDIVLHDFMMKLIAWL